MTPLKSLKSLEPEERAKMIKEKTGVAMDHIGHFSLDTKGLHPNIENFIGIAQVPLGIAGPIHVDGEYAKGDFLVPVAGIRKGVVERISRGLELIGKRKIQTTISSSFMTRGPVLKAPTARYAKEMADWVGANFSILKQEAETTTKHGKLLWIKPYIVGRNLFLRFAYDTSKAMGMNMATIATDKALGLVEKNFPEAKHIALAGNMCIDKKPAFLNYIEGRGKHVTAEVFLEGAKGSSPKPGFADAAAGIYLATGQDLAHSVELNNGDVLFEQTPKGLYCALSITNIQVGTIGGGTRVETQKECLKIMGCDGAEPEKLAEIIAAAALAHEIGNL